MHIGTAASWPVAPDDLRPIFQTHDRLNVAASILDGLCVSALLWLGIALILS